ncbi:hypothetical protein GMJAKD_09110 [Candidatus Electrothrix aarhusensis]
MTIYHSTKKNFKFIFFAAIILFAAVISEKQRLQNFSSVDARAEIMALDPGFSSGNNLLSENERNIFGVATKMYAGLKGYIVGFSNRPTLPRLDIDIGFMKHQQLMEDRKRAVAAGILTNPTKVKAKIRFQNHIYKAKLRLKGDVGGHWITKKRMSFRINLKGKNNILGFKTFSIQKPIERQHPFDQVFQSIVRRAGNLASQHKYIRVFVNGDSWGVMNMEEHMSEELIEKQKKKDSIIIRFSNEKIWELRRKNEKLTQACRLSDSRLNIHLYSSNDYLKETKFRKQLTYIAQERLKPYHAYLYDIDQYSKALILASSWNFFHTLVHSNCRHYLNPYTLKLEPITTDQGKFIPINIDNQGKWQPETNSPFNMELYQQILHTDLFQYNFTKNLKIANKALLYIEKDLNYYQSFFPLDKKEDAEIVHNNLKIINKYQEKFFLQHRKDIFSPDEESGVKKNIPISVKEAAVFPEHVYARHYDDGRIEIYNLLHEPVELRKILLGDENHLKNQITIPGYTGYKPYIIRTGITGIQDNNLTIETEFKGNTRRIKSGITLVSENIINPLLRDNQEKITFLHKNKEKEWEIPPGTWNIDYPVTINGSLKISPDVRLKFAENAYLIIKGSIEAKGENGNIVFEPQRESWKGLYVINADKISVLDSVVIRNTKALEDSLLILTGGVTFYSSDVQMENVVFDGTEAEDALNIIKSNFNLKKISIRSTVSGGFDSDFSSGLIESSSFTKIGGDGVDFSGSVVKLYKNDFAGIKDKAISVGEASSVQISKCAIEDVGVGVAVKDGSQATLEDSTVKKYKLSAAMTYMKKSFFSTPSLMINKSEFEKEADASLLRQSGTVMTIDGRDVTETEFDSRNLYEIGFMKK